MAHIPDGVLSLPVLAFGVGVTLVGCAWGLRRLDAERIPQTALLSAVFFVAALAHFPVGPTSVHLILNGLVGAMLGPAAFPAILIALLLQAMLFGFGGLATLGVNVMNMAVPAVLAGALFRWGLTRWGAADRRVVALAGAAGAAGVALTALGMAAALAASGGEFRPAAQLALYAHLPVMVIEAFFTAAAVGFMLRVKPAFFAATYQDNQHPSPVPGEGGAAGSGRGPGAETQPPRAALISLILLLPLLLLSSPAQAHKLKLFAGAEGADITGYAYFSGGGRAQDAAVIIRNPDGAAVFSGRTDLQGEFRFTAPRRADYLIHIDSGDGHQADFTVWARELPDNLPTAAPPTLSPGPPPPVAATAPPAAVMPAPAAAPAMPADELTAQIERAVAKQVRPLREQLDAFQDQTRWRDVVGGLGWIIGLGGLAYGLANRRKRGEQP